jgi:hypothetical protein
MGKPLDRCCRQGRRHWGRQPQINALLNLALMLEAWAGLQLFLVVPNASPEDGKYTHGSGEKLGPVWRPVLTVRHGQ